MSGDLPKIDIVENLKRLRQKIFTMEHRQSVLRNYTRKKVFDTNSNNLFREYSPPVVNSFFPNDYLLMHQQSKQQQLTPSITISLKYTQKDDEGNNNARQNRNLNPAIEKVEKNGPRIPPPNDKYSKKKKNHHLLKFFISRVRAIANRLPDKKTKWVHESAKRTELLLREITQRRKEIGTVVTKVSKDHINCTDPTEDCSDDDLFHGDEHDFVHATESLCNGCESLRTSQFESFKDIQQSDSNSYSFVQSAENTIDDHLITPQYESFKMISMKNSDSNSFVKSERKNKSHSGFPRHDFVEKSFKSAEQDFPIMKIEDRNDNKNSESCDWTVTENETYSDCETWKPDMEESGCFEYDNSEPDLTLVDFDSTYPNFYEDCDDCECSDSSSSCDSWPEISDLDTESVSTEVSDLDPEEFEDTPSRKFFESVTQQEESEESEDSSLDEFEFCDDLTESEVDKLELQLDGPDKSLAEISRIISDFLEDT